MGNQNPRQEALQIQLLSAETQSQQLFDYSSLSKQEDAVSNLQFPSFIACNGSNILYVQESQLNESLQCLYKIDRLNYTQIKIQELFERNIDNQDLYIWKVLKENEEYMLLEGDLVKIGRTKIQFKQIVTAQQLIAAKSKNLNGTAIQNIETTRDEKFIHSTQDQCRVCFENQQTIDNPLISLCKCSGTVKYIHYQCLRDWIYNDIKHEKSTNYIYYSYFEPMCELCKSSISNEFETFGNKFVLYDFQKLEPPYAVFQNKSYDEQAKKFRIQKYLITLPNMTEISVGRNHNSKVVLRDISVSRSHCSLVYKNNHIFIQDQKSKFGTLILPKRKLEFEARQGIQLQFQSKLIKILQPASLDLCCCSVRCSYSVEILEKNQSSDTSISSSQRLDKNRSNVHDSYSQSHELMM